MRIRKLHLSALACSALFMATGCTTMTAQTVNEPALAIQIESVQFEQDRQAIIAMAGNYHVDFDFNETVSFVEGYEAKDPYHSGGYEVVRVIEDRGTFISLQHILVVGKDEKFPVKHWRQDWTYEPAQVLIFIGGNAWEIRDVSAQTRTGAWSQVVYQVDDSPRYGAVATWSHEDGISEWEPNAEWRPLPRRDMVKRYDYHAVNAVNRHAITPDGWVHEQDNSKLILRGAPQVLVRENGVNTYLETDDFDVSIAENYWAGTATYWAEVRTIWNELESEGGSFALTLQGEPADLYMPLLELASQVEAGEETVPGAANKAREVIAKYTTRDIGTLASRLRPDVQIAEY